MPERDEELPAVRLDVRARLPQGLRVHRHTERPGELWRLRAERVAVRAAVRGRGAGLQRDPVRGRREVQEGRVRHR